jgi:hypothetical protein
MDGSFITMDGLQLLLRWQLFHFHCTVHRQKNITSTFKMKFDKVHSCRWMFGRLVDCKSHFDVLKLAEKHFDKMSEKAVAI